jgi:hypothetical protein
LSIDCQLSLVLNLTSNLPKNLPKKEIERLLDANFIQPCRYAEWISNIVPVYKKNGKMRVCIDFRDLNRATPMDGYPMPVADLLVDAAAGHKFIILWMVMQGTIKYLWQ